MSQSKGGHSAKEGSEEGGKFVKLMIDFEDVSLDVRTIIDIEKSFKSNKDIEEGIEYLIKIIRNTYPGELVRSYASEEARDVALSKLRSKMEMCNTIFL